MGQERKGKVKMEEGTERECGKQRGGQRGRRAARGRGRGRGRQSANLSTSNPPPNNPLETQKVCAKETFLGENSHSLEDIEGLSANNTKVVTPELL